MRRGMVCGLVGILALSIAGQVFSNGRTKDPLGVAVSPQTLILSMNQGGAVTVHTAIPLANVDTSSLMLNGIPADSAWADNLGNLVARFDEEAVETDVSPPRAVLTLEGMMTGGTSFSGSDSVRVIE